jgi:hypothetical protein
VVGPSITFYVGKAGGSLTVGNGASVIDGRAAIHREQRMQYHARSLSRTQICVPALPNCPIYDGRGLVPSPYFCPYLLSLVQAAFRKSCKKHELRALVSQLQDDAALFPLAAADFVASIEPIGPLTRQTGERRSPAEIRRYILASLDDDRGFKRL